MTSRALNKRFNHLDVNEHILVPLQRILRGLALHRGAAYRYGGGDEFLILFSNHDLTETVALAKRLESVVSQAGFAIPGHPVKVTLSIGAASWPRDGAIPAEAIRRADDLAGEAKKEGKNRIKASG